MEPQTVSGVHYVHLVALRAVITIEPHETEGVAYVFDGPSDALVVSRDHVTLTLSMTQRDSTTNVGLRIWVSPLVSVLIDRVQGDVTIGDIRGDLSVLAMDSAVHAGHIGSAKLTAMGSGSIHVESVQQYLEMRTQRSGVVRVEDGTVEYLVAVTEREGSIWYGGRAERGRLVVYGDGPITLHHIERRPTIFPIGSGKVTIEHLDQ